MVNIVTAILPAQAVEPERKEFTVVKIKRYKLIELAEFYEVDKRTLREWLDKFKEELGIRNGHYYSIRQVKLIFSKLELPSYIRIETE